MPVLLLFAAVVPVLIGLRVATIPASVARVAAFARRHGLELTPGDQAFVTAYLSHTRRWRLAGALGGYLVGLASALPQERVTLQLFPVLTGWFVGAVVAEFRFHPRPDAERQEAALVPRWLLRVPHALAVSAVGGAALILAFDRAGGRPERVLAWGTGALACAAVLAAVNRRVVNRPAGGAAARAVAAHAIGVLTAVGCALGIACLAYQVTVIQDRFFDAAATAIGGIALMWTLGGLYLGWLLASAARRGAAASPAPVLLVVAALVAVSAGAAGYAWWRDHPPYGPAAAHATATLRFTDERHFARDTGALGITGLNTLVDQPSQQQFIGRVDYTRPAGAAGSTYHVIVIDKRQNRIATPLFGSSGSGWSSQLSRLAARYPWLSATAPVVDESGYSAEGSAVSTDADTPGPVTFVGSLPGPPASPADLMVVLVLTGPDEQTYWATRISG